MVNARRLWTAGLQCRRSSKASRDIRDSETIALFGSDQIPYEKATNLGKQIGIAHKSLSPSPALPKVKQPFQFIPDNPSIDSESGRCSLPLGTLSQDHSSFVPRIWRASRIFGHSQSSLSYLSLTHWRVALDETSIGDYAPLAFRLVA